jgi:uracil-DNA glycosylase
MTTRLDYLQAMGVDSWVPRDASTEMPEAIPDATVTLDVIPVVCETSLETLKDQVTTCQQCTLGQSRTQTVFGVGNPNADLMFIGEAPGQQEDRQGEPFVGRAGLLLNEMLLSIGLSRDDIFIANILKCRPPNNRDPNPEEVVSCTPFLLQQIDLIQPKLIISLGRISAHFLLNTKTALGKLRADIHHYHNTPLIATYHPAYLLRSPGEKARAWDDFQRIKGYL